EFSYRYDNGVPLLAQTRYPDGTGYSYTYDSRHRLLAVSDLAGVVLSRHGYEGDKAAWTEGLGGFQHRTFAYEDVDELNADEKIPPGMKLFVPENTEP